ncbi:MAG: extracellular solute-binding protein [Nitriliruptorales bacterium]|nr:extracellular solute-binding protein [Nitriliruptorales bacterium]
MRLVRWKPIRGGRLAGPAALVLLVVACSGSPTADRGAGTASEGATAAGGESGAALQEVYAAVEGLTGDERRQKLLELAEEEGAEVSFYTTFALEEAEPVIAEFEEDTDITVDVYRAPSSSFMQRVLREAEAGFAGSDVVSSNGTEMVLLEDEGLLAPLETPMDDDLPESYLQSERWAPNYLNVFTPAWNTNAVSPEEAPEAWDEVLKAENLSLEITDGAWFMELVTYFRQEHGMSEEEAIALFEQASDGAIMIDGHSVQNELLAGGEFDVAAATYMHRSMQFVNDGAPVAWEPAVEPMIASPNGIGIHRDASRPATALLFIEYMLTDSQELMGELGRTPVFADAPSGTGEYEVIVLDTNRYGEERQKWDDLYDGIVGGGEPAS